MRIQLTARTRAFTILGNEVLRDRRLSFTARGILFYLLSLPDGAREDVRTLADRNPGVGRRGIAKAVGELVELGYYVRRTVRDHETGQVRTEVCVFDTPQTNQAPLPAPPGTGEAADGRTGTNPGKNLEKEPSLPGGRGAKAVLPRQRRAAPQLTVVAESLPAVAEMPTPDPETLARGTALLARLSRWEPKLALSASDTLALAPLALRWLDGGVSDPEIRALLTPGLPEVIHSPRALLAHRLTHKLPPPRDEFAAQTPALAECATCRDPLPRAQRTGICAPCSGAAARPSPTKASAKSVAEHVAALRKASKGRAWNGSCLAT